MRAVMAELNAAREIAVAQRKYVEVAFIGNDTLRVTRHEDPAGDVTTILRDIRFESGVRYELLESVGDTPDAFGVAAAVDFGGAETLRFSTDGSLIDLAGAPVNGSVFLAAPGLVQSQRAVTVLGSTGRVRGYRWTGAAWRRV
jgi:hypothetical protein